MALVAHNFNALDVQSTLYVFENIGDTLPLHRHAFDHTSVVCYGDVEFFNDSGKCVPKTVGQAMIFRAGKPHGIRALTAGAVVHNIMPPSKNPLPGAQSV